MTAALFLLLAISQGVHCDHWEVRTPKMVTASEGSCIQIPCTFDHPARSPLSEVMWLKDNKTHGSLVIDSKGLSNSSFLHRTQLHPRWEVEKDCTLTVNGLTHRDVGRYYFRMKTKDDGKFSGPDGVLVNISDVSNLPRISSAEEMVEGKEVELTCSVKYACPGHLRWNSSDGLDRLLETAGTVQNEGRSSLTLRFVASHQDHGRTLRCVQTSSQGKPLVQSITLNVKYAPRFAQLTLSPFKPINRGGSVTLRCGVGDSNPPVTRYRWHQSGLGTTQSRETLMATHRLNNVYGHWEHWCEATNSVGTATSEKTKLPVYDSYSWAVWTPLSLHAREGSCVIIPCRFRIPGSGGGDSTATGIWLKSDHYHGARVYHTSAGSDGDFAGRVEFLGNMESGNCSLKIRDLRASDSDKYYFRIEASAGKWSDPIGFKLLVSGDLQKPVITVPERVVDGEGASLTCSVYSYCPEDTPVFEWHLPHFAHPQETRTVFKDDQWIYSSTVVYVPTFGTTQPVVKCTANFGPGTPTAETEVSLDVQYPPRNVTISLTVNRGTDTHSMKEWDRVVLSCDCITAHPAVREYTWFRDGTEVRGERSSSLQFPSISYKDYGKYACQASNEVGKSRSAELTVMGKYRPQGVHVEYRVNGVRSETTDVKENDRLDLTCVSTGSDPPISGYSWHWDGWQMRQEQVLQIERITRQHHSNNYHCQAQNAIGTGRSETFTINVQYAPTDVRITSFGAAVVGKYITLSCTSVANPAATYYSWKKVCDSQPTDLGTNSQDYPLWVTRAVASCDYYCKAKNSVGERESPPQRTDVQYAPTDVRVTSPRAAVVGEHITLLCESDANPAPAYSWRNVCGSRSTNLWRYSQDYQLWVSQADTSCDYYCKAKNSVGERESPPQRIDVHYAPTNVRIISPRATVVVGEHITLSCESDATPAPAYSWRKVCGSRSTDLGGNGIKYQFHVKVEDASCNYHCRARNSVGERESPPHHIDVHYKPKDVKIQSVDSVVEGAQATLQCQSAANPPAKTYLWKKVCSGREERLEGTTSELQIQFSSWDESCDYYCRAGNGIGDQDSGPKRFNVHYAPRDTEIVSSETSAPVREGASLTLRCRSKGSPPPQYSWYRGAGPHQPLQGSGPELTLSHLHSSDAGNYSCGAANGIGSSRSRTLQVEVLYGPRNTRVSVSAPLNLVREGGNVTLTCRSDSYPPVKTYRWLRSDGITNTTVGTTSHRLHLYGLTAGQSVYYCLVSVDSRTQTSQGIKLRVPWSYRKKVAIGLTPVIIVIILILIVAGILYYRHRKKRQDSLSHWSTDATNVVYSVVNKPKPRERTVYENMVLTENAHGQSAPEESIHASVSFHHGPNRKRSAPHTDTAWTAGSRDPDIKVRGEPGVVYSQVCVQPRPTKNQTSDDYENIGHLCARADDESDEEISYTTVVLPPPSKPSLLRRPSEDSIEYTNLRR